uniref:Integrase, catalytic region, zinc finger, CCHC-type, peptidase aspartic, catalytic n=1 Tax=Tanacetum cinerariifolium TaxID=118510 RepID=A0A6L2JP84_TANCI|nr:hypothetical protein [Tanacetum cinerariifolium]
MTIITPEAQQQSSFVSSGFISNMLNPNLNTIIDSILNLNTESTSMVDVPVTTNLEMPSSSVTTLPLPHVPLIQPQQQTPVPLPAIVSSFSLQNLLTFRSLFKFKDKVKASEDDFSEFKQTNLFAESVSSILDIVDVYLANKMNEPIKTVVQPQSDRFKDETQAKNEDFINKLDENIKKIIKEQVKVQVKEKVSKIFLKIKKLANDQVEYEVLTRSSNEAKTSHDVAANLSKLELKKILIDKMESNKSIYQLVQHKSLYKAFIDAYETDKVILNTYGDTLMIKRHRDDEDDDKEPSNRSNQGSKRRKAGKEPESTSEPKEKTSKTTGKSTEGSKSHQKSTGKSAQAEKPIHTTDNLEEPAPQEFDTVGPTFELMKGSCKNLVELEYFHEEVYKETTDQLNWNNLKGQQYPHDLRKPLHLIPNSQGHRVIPFDHFINNDLAYLRGDDSSRTYATIITVTKLHIVEWHNYKHLDWITVCRHDDKLYTFKEERLALNVSLRMFERSVVIQKRVEDLQLGVESYQKKLNLTRPNTYRSDLKRLSIYSAYPNPRGFIYQNKDKKNRLMHIDELYKFSDGTLNDVRTTLDDILKRIRMKYLSQTY